MLTYTYWYSLQKSQKLKITVLMITSRKWVDDNVIYYKTECYPVVKKNKIKS